jgi:ATP adenylyltransferase/5',5'''-P-1,P-4-tetraphosphate phosphorylase II
MSSAKRFIHKKTVKNDEKSLSFLMLIENRFLCFVPEDGIEPFSFQTIVRLFWQAKIGGALLFLP